VIANNVPDQHQIVVQVQAAGTDNWNSTFSFTISAPSMHIAALTIDDSENGNGNGMLDPGEEVQLVFDIINLGNSLSPDLLLQLIPDNDHLTLNITELPHEGLPPGENCVLSFSATVDPETEMGDVAGLSALVTAGAYEANRQFNLEIGMIVEDFESGDFSQLNWEYSGNQPWTICEIDPAQGIYCARSGSINHNQTSELNISVFVAALDTISFYRKVSSQAGYDLLKFYDGPLLLGEWSGIEAWQKVSFPVYPGYHTFKWIYQKDNYSTQGEDCAWIDYIRFPKLLQSNISAGEDDMVCSGEPYQTKSSGVYLNNILWTTSGTGTFNNPGILQPVYTPGEEDIIEGSVELTISATGADNTTLTDSFILSIVNEPETPEQPDGDSEVCTNWGLIYTYAIAEVPFTLDYIWELIPEEAGSINMKANTADITWTPDYTGEVQLHVKAVNDCGESAFSESLHITANICTGIDEGNKNSISIYPNPGNGLFFITFPHGIGEVQLSVYNAYGQSVSNSTVQATGESIQLDLQNQPAGNYYLNIKTRDLDFSEKVVIR